MKVLEFDNVHRSYRAGVPVLKGVGFSLEAGEVVGLVGKNGAGKTTLMKIALAMIRPQQGSVRVFGMSPFEQPLEVKRRVGYVSEDQVLPEHFRVQEVLDFHRGLFPTWDEAMADGLVERFGLERGQKIKALSKGQARQVALVCAVAHRPELLLLDEPAGGLDPAARREFLETSIQLLNEGGTTILFSSHHMQDIERLATRVVLLDEGRVLVDADLDTLREELCLTVMPRVNGVTRERVAALPGCLRARMRPGAVHAVFREAPERVRALIEADLGLEDVAASRIPLEDLFVELVGGNA